MSEYHNIGLFLYKAVPITRVASAQWGPITGGLQDRPDGTGANVALGIGGVAQRGVVTFLDQAEAAKFADKHEADGTFTFTVLDAIDAADITVEATVVKTGPVRGKGHTLGGSGPFQVEFSAATIGEPS